jgi:hypothetical protein
VKVDGRVNKNGGNVASYFCTPAGRVIHAVVGPVNADELLEEAQWAIDTFAALANAPLRDQVQYVGMAHQTALGREVAAPNWGKSKWSRPVAAQTSPRRGGRSQQIHELLAEQPMATLVSVYQEIFEHILGQRISKAAPNLALADRLLHLAERDGRPLLFVIHRHHENSSAYDEWQWQLKRRTKSDVPLQAMLRDYVVVMLPLREMPALSQRLGRPPFDAPNQNSPLFVVARSNGEQLGSVTGWNSLGELCHLLAYGNVEAMKERPPSIPRLREAVQFMSKIDAALADELRQLAAQVIAAEAEKRKKPLEERLAVSS